MAVVFAEIIRLIAIIVSFFAGVMIHHRRITELEEKVERMEERVIWGMKE